jgi:hypothetical protein
VQLDGEKKGNPVKIGSGLRHCKQKFCSLPQIFRFGKFWIGFLGKSLRENEKLNIRVQVTVNMGRLEQ